MTIESGGVNTTVKERIYIRPKQRSGRCLIGVIVLSLLCFTLALQVSRMLSIIPPWPDEPWSLVLAVVLNWSSFGNAYLPFLLCVVAVHLANWRIYRRRMTSRGDFRRFWSVLRGRAQPVFLIFASIVLLSQIGHRDFFSLAFLILLATLFFLPFVFNHRRFCCLLPIAMIFIGFTTVNFFIPQQALHFQCKPNGELVMEDGRRVACQSVINLPEAGIMLVNSGGRRLVLETADIKLESLEQAIVGRGYLIR